MKDRKATIRVPSLKITVPLAAAALPRDLVPMEGPAGDPAIEMELEGGGLKLLAKVNGKNYRRMLKQLDEQGPENFAIILQGTLRPPTAGGPLVLEGAGFQAMPKAPKPASAVGAPAPSKPEA